MMDLVNECPYCGAPIYGQLRIDDPMYGVEYSTCTCSIDLRDTFCVGDEALGSGDFKGSPFGWGE